MAASANPAAGNNGGQEGTNNANGTTNNGVSVPDNSVIGPNQGELIHSRGLAVEWSPDEQSLLEELLAKYATDKPIHRYAKIAMQLKDKCVRDIALRCRWMSKKENGKRRKDDQVSRKNKDKKEKITDSMPKSTHAANRTNGPPYAQAVMSMDSDDGISYQGIGHSYSQLSTNLVDFLNLVKLLDSGFGLDFFCASNFLFLDFLRCFEKFTCYQLDFMMLEMILL
ncbi:uncharacterized protein [Nicotiana tomentosiformis]|uniref:uncharacterized protein isoform X2 n=1 Tax=Nicotiana tomentosiformis TaxID=4098 RepID=UPI0008787BE5